MKRLIAMAEALLLLAGCGTEAGQTRYVVLFSGGEVVAQLRTNKPVTYTSSGRCVIDLPDGHWITWRGDYLISDVPVEDVETVIDLMGG